MIHFSAIYRAGCNAALDGEPSSVNPYRRYLSPAWWAWVDGHNHGMALIRRAQRTSYALPAPRMKP
jgi:hypothetical protein